jgi:hypothetical protein
MIIVLSLLRKRAAAEFVIPTAAPHSCAVERITC